MARILNTTNQEVTLQNFKIKIEPLTYYTIQEQTTLKIKMLTNF